MQRRPRPRRVRGACPKPSPQEDDVLPVTAHARLDPEIVNDLWQMLHVQLFGAEEPGRAPDGEVVEAQRQGAGAVPRDREVGGAVVRGELLLTLARAAVEVDEVDAVAVAAARV